MAGDIGPRVIVKFRDEVNLDYKDGAEEQVIDDEIGPWKELALQFPGITLKVLFNNPGPDKIKVLVARARELNPNYKAPNFATYFAIDVPAGSDPAELAKSLSTWDKIQTAYVQGGPVRPPVNPDDPMRPNQGHLNAAPGGIDAEFAWTVPGGDGQGVQFIDLEHGWLLDHEDLVGAGITLISGLNHDSFSHGTSVLGIVAGVDNQNYGIGITPEVKARVVSPFRSAAVYSTAEAIASALTALNVAPDFGFGDVLLLEAQTQWLLDLVPVEVELAEYDAIVLGVAMGVTIVEAAGNGGLDLDTFVVNQQAILNRQSPNFRESGAVMVAGATSRVPHRRLAPTNFGSRIDCYGWGQGIRTIGGGDPPGLLRNGFTGSFNGTSGAAAIVAGAAIAVQAMAKANLGNALDPAQLRTLLSNPALNFNTRPANFPAAKIGVMPNLRAIVNSVNP